MESGLESRFCRKCLKVQPELPEEGWRETEGGEMDEGEERDKREDVAAGEKGEVERRGGERLRGRMRTLWMVERV